MAFGEDLILRTKLQTPRLRRWTLPRPRLLDRLNTALEYRLTVLDAPTGYGKSTLLAGWLAAAQHPFVWYNIGSIDTDPIIFLLHLIYSFRQPAGSENNLSLPDLGDRALEALEREWHDRHNSAERRMASLPILQLFINEVCLKLPGDIIIVLDDFHLLDNQPEVARLAEDLINLAPANLHFVIASRHIPVFENMAYWQAKFEILTIGKEALAFTPAETARLFEECYGYSLSPEQANRLSSETEGWIIALQMVWQNLQSPQTGLDAILRDLPGNLSGLFEYLAREVLNRQKPDVQRFLQETSFLRRLTGPLCDAVLQIDPGQGEKMLRELYDAGLFLIGQGTENSRSYRYHHLFGEFLSSRLNAEPTRALALHRRAAICYLTLNQPEDALHHHIMAKDWTPGAELLETGLGNRLLETGRLERLEQFLADFPPDFITNRPGLNLLKGDYLRLTSRFEEALQCYRQAATGYETILSNLEGLTLAYRGRALIYLDTVQPAIAEEWLERALETARRTSDTGLQATLLHDLAENKLNRGRPLEAEELHTQAYSLLGIDEDHRPQDVRILLRSGRIARAVQILEQPLDRENGTTSGKSEKLAGLPRRVGRNHRESLLVLSLLESIRGEGEKAASRAEQGIFLGRELRAPFTEAVAWQRLGHALNVKKQFPEALKAYRQGLELADYLQIPRLKVEGQMGLCLLFGSHREGSLEEARHAAEEGLLISRRAGDEWIEGFLQLSLAGALVESGEPAEAIRVAQTALAVLENCGDKFGVALARLWVALATGKAAELAAACDNLTRQGYSFVIERPTLFGPKSPVLLTQLARIAQQGKTPEKERINNHNPSPETTSKLKITTLGIFSVTRPDGTELSSRDWQREKARQLFQLLLTRRDKPLPKEQILEYLWPENDPASADSGFKVALNALVRALEPDRSSRTQSTYVLRSGSGPGLAYYLNPESSLVWLDAAEFENLAGQGVRAELSGENGKATALALYEEALELYRGDFLPGCLYEDWAAPERERLLTLFLSTAERLTRLLAESANWSRCLEICQLILARDNCWEEAYRLMMLAYWRQGNRAAALRTYEKCNTVLAEELGLEPMPQTLKLYQKILNG